MAVTSGFFNALNNDRKYNAEQISAIFDGLIHDGVFDSVGEIFGTVPGDGLQVLVKTGKAWFHHTWTLNDTILPLNLAPADVTRPRYDAVVLEVNTSEAVRNNSIKVLTGTPEVTPSRPAMIHTETVNQYPLAYVMVPAAATEVTASNIQIKVGSSDCPFVTGIVSSVDIDDLFQTWNGEFDEWFTNLKAQLSDNVVANLQAQIDQKLDKADKATDAEALAGTNDTKYMTPKKVKESVEEKIGIVSKINNILEIGSQNQIITSGGINSIYFPAYSNPFYTPDKPDDFGKNRIFFTKDYFVYAPVASDAGIPIIGSYSNPGSLIQSGDKLSNSGYYLRMADDSNTGFLVSSGSGYNILKVVFSSSGATKTSLESTSQWSFYPNLIATEKWAVSKNSSYSGRLSVLLLSNLTGKTITLNPSMTPTPKAIVGDVCFCHDPQVGTQVVNLSNQAILAHHAFAYNAEFGVIDGTVVSASVMSPTAAHSQIRFRFFDPGTGALLKTVNINSIYTAYSNTSGQNSGTTQVVVFKQGYIAVYNKNFINVFKVNAANNSVTHYASLPLTPEKGAVVFDKIHGTLYAMSEYTEYTGATYANYHFSLYAFVPDHGFVFLKPSPMFPNPSGKADQPCVPIRTSTGINVVLPAFPNFPTIASYPIDEYKLAVPFRKEH